MFAMYSHFIICLNLISFRLFLVSNNQAGLKMESVISYSSIKSSLKTYVIDLLLVLFIYFLPALSHLIAFPVYYLDPMRIALVIALMFTSKKNSILIAVTLPLFSFLISSHPQILKALLLSAELLINLFLFYLLKDKIKNTFASLFISILFSKIVYYGLKFVFINSGLIEDKLFSTPFYMQFAAAVFLSVLLFGYESFYRRKN